MSAMLYPSMASALGAGFMYDLECGTSGFGSWGLDGPTSGIDGAAGAAALLALFWPENRVSGDATLRLITEGVPVPSTVRDDFMGAGVDALPPRDCTFSDCMASLRDVLGAGLAAFQGGGRAADLTVSQAIASLALSFSAAASAWAWSNCCFLRSF